MRHLDLLTAGLIRDLARQFQDKAVGLDGDVHLVAHRLADLAVAGCIEFVEFADLG